MGHPPSRALLTPGIQPRPALAAAPPTAGEVDPLSAVLRAGAGAVGGSPGPCGSPERVPDPAWEMGERAGAGAETWRRRRQGLESH